MLLNTRQPMNSSRRKLPGVLPVFQTPYQNTIVRGPVGFQLNEETEREVDQLFERLMKAIT